MRWFTPLFLAVVTVGVGWMNATSEGTRIVFPFLEAVVGPDPDALSRATLVVLGGLALVSGVWTAVRGPVSSGSD